MPHYTREILVRFGHCDPAGIVFYPRYFEMINSVVEDWFAEGLGHSFADLLGRADIATPTVHFTVDFLKPSMIGEYLIFSLAVADMSRRSCRLEISVSCGGETRMTVEQVLVFTRAVARTTATIPDDILVAMRRYLKDGGSDRSQV